MPMNINYITIITLGGIKKKKPETKKKNDKTVWTTKQAGARAKIDLDSVSQRWLR